MNTKHVYITTNGKELEIRAVSLDELRMGQAGIKREFVERGEPLEPPTYEFEVFGGGKESRPHDKTTLKTEEDKAAWALHQGALARLAFEQAKLVQEIVFEDGIAAQIPADGFWEARMQRRHVEIPEDPEHKRWQYILTEYLKTPQDIKACISQVILISSEGSDNQAEISAALEAFLSPTGHNGTQPEKSPRRAHRSKSSR